MKQTYNADELLLAQAAPYPRLKAQDLVKALYQAEFGSGHFVADSMEGRAFLLNELAREGDIVRAVQPPLVEPLGPAFCRVHLARLREVGLEANTLFALFALSGRESAGSMEQFLADLSRLETLVREGSFQFDAEEALAFLRGYRAAGCPPLSHSEAFRAAYAPAYRVIKAEYAPFLPVFAALDRLLARPGAVKVAIEGGSASGKTSLAALLKQVYDCNVFHMDDFFLQAHQRTPERYKEPGGNVDHERFGEEVLRPLVSGQAFSYRPFNCQTMDFDPAVQVTPRRLSVIEGAYSLHPSLAPAYDLAVFLDIDKETQARRILRRNGPAMQRRFLTEWIPLEEAYFAANGAKARCQVVIDAGTQQTDAD